MSTRPVIATPFDTHRARVRRLVGDGHSLVWTTRHGERYSLDIATCRHCEGRLSIRFPELRACVGDDLRQPCAERPRRFLVIGYDDDQGQACFEQITARNDAVAREQLGDRRPHLTAVVCALTADDLRRMAAGLEGK